MPVPFGLPAELAELQDDYDIRGELGRGGAAVVYRAVDRALGRDVAIKVVHPRPTSPDDDPVARLAREARMVAQLQHPNIVAVYAVRRLRGGGLALIMQLVDGGTLKTAVQDGGPLPPDRAELLLRDVASALAYAHARGVIHRDVKPENIFLDEQSGMALLADFGIARSTASDSMTMTGIAVGTPFYMSPEQVDGGAVDGRSDLYSLGLATWEALTGHRPWDGETLYNVMHRQKFDELPPIEALRTGVPRRLQYVVERMLQKRPGARWAGAEGLISQLDHPVLPADFTRWQKALPARVERYRAAEAARAAERAAVAAELSEPLASASTLHFSPGGLPARGVPGLLVAPPAGADAARPWVPGPAGETIGGSGGPRASAGRVTRAGDLDALLPEPGMTVDLHDTAAALVHDTPEEMDTPTAVRYPDVIEPSWGRSPSAVWRAARSPRAALVAAAALGLIGTGGVLTFDRLGPGRAGMGDAVRALGLGSATAPIARSASGRGDAATARTSGATATPDAHLADEAPTTSALR
jgi:hypothetical protein